MGKRGSKTINFGIAYSSFFNSVLYLLIYLGGGQPGGVASKHGKPFSIFGVTIQNIDLELESLLKKAAFIYTRERSRSFK